MPLSEQRRSQLDDIVQQMSQNKESDSYIQGVVNDFKTKYADEKTEAPKSFLSKAFDTVKNVASLPGKFGEKVVVQPAIGFAKKAANTALNIGELGGKALDTLSPALGKASSPALMSSARAALEPTNLSQKLGGIGESATEFLAPAGEIAKGAKFIDMMLAGKGLLPALGRVGGKALLEGAVAAPISAAQSGNLQQGGQTGLITAGLSAATGAFGAAAKGLGIPEKLYQKFFKSTADDALAELRSTVNQDLKRSDPAKYAKLLNLGIIQEKAGQTVLDETLAKKALESGLSGSIDNMAKTVIKQNYNNELAAREITASIKKPLTLEQNYKKTLDLIAAAYKDAGLGKISEKAASLSGKIGADGKILASDALDVRRFLDGMRSRASFASDTPLPLKQENLKELTDALRGKINALPGMGKVMDSYSTNIDLAESLAKEAARRGNNQVVSMLDAGLFGGGLLSGQPLIGGTLGIARRLLNSPTAMTGAAQLLNRSAPTAAGFGARAIAGSTVAPFIQQNK